MKLELDYLLEWQRMVVRAKQQLNGTCPLIEDETVVLINDYIKWLEDQSLSERST